MERRGAQSPKKEKNENVWYGTDDGRRQREKNIYDHRAKVKRRVEQV